LLGVAALKQGNSLSGTMTRADLMPGMVGSNRIAYLPVNYQQEQNSCSPLTFEWTNRSGSTSSNGSFSPGRLN
jgi:hypothetical protein